MEGGLCTTPCVRGRLVRKRERPVHIVLYHGGGVAQRLLSWAMGGRGLNRRCVIGGRKGACNALCQGPGVACVKGGRDCAQCVALWGGVSKMYLWERCIYEAADIFVRSASRCGGKCA